MTTTTIEPRPVEYITPAKFGGPPMGKRPGSGRFRPAMWPVYAALLVVCACGILPFLWMLSTSLKTSAHAMDYPPRWWPHPFQWRNYWEVLTSEKFNFRLWARNTLVIEVLTVTGTTISSAIVAYGFAKIRFKGRSALFAIMLATMMIPFPVTMVSLFSMFRWLDGRSRRFNGSGTFWPLWVPAWFGSAFSIFLLRQFFLTIPDDLSESARIDGCSELGIFLRDRPAAVARQALTVVAALFAFMGTWNDYLGPLIYLQRPEQFTLALGLQNL